MKKISRLTLATSAAAMVLLLSACSGAQSTAQACDILQKSPITTGEGLEDSMAEAMKSGGSLKDAFTPLSTELEKLTKEITNEELSASVVESNDAVKEILDVVGDVKVPSMEDIDPTDADAMAEIEKMQSEFEALAADLGTASSKLTTSLAQLNTVCSAL